MTSGGVPGGRDQSMPGAGIEAFQAGFVHGRQVGQDRRALERRHGQRTHLAAFDMADHRSGGGKHHLVVTGDDILQGRRRALVGHVHDIDLRLRLEQFAGEMRGRAVAGRRKIDLAGLRLARARSARSANAPGRPD